MKKATYKKQTITITRKPWMDRPAVQQAARALVAEPTAAAALQSKITDAVVKHQHVFELVSGIAALIAAADEGRGIAHLSSAVNLITPALQSLTYSASFSLGDVLDDVNELAALAGGAR